MTSIYSTTEFITTTTMEQTTLPCRGSPAVCEECGIDPCSSDKCPYYCSSLCDTCNDKCRRETKCECQEDNTQPFCCQSEEPPKGGCNKPMLLLQNTNNFCHCADHGDRGDQPVNASQCGLPALEDPLGDIANPDEVIEALIPGFLKENAGPSGLMYSVWSYVSSIFDRRTDNVDDEYRPVYIPESYLGDENPPAWGTFNITEQGARDHCTQYIQQSDVYATCSSIVSQTSFQTIVQKCVSDIQRTGNLDWANDKVYEYQDRCMKLIFSQNYISNRDDPMSDPSFGPQMELFLDTSCTDDCSGHGSCHNGACQCDQGFVGGSCATPEGTSPTVGQYLGPDVCDVQERLCQSVKLQATNLVKSEKLECRVHVEQLNGQATVLNYKGHMHTGTTVQCPLPDLLTLDLGDAILPPSAAYMYSVEVSNDGVNFQSTSSVMPRVVVDSLCMDCVSGSSCNQKDNTCMVGGQCHAAGDVVDVCYGCYPENNMRQLTVNPNLPKPEVTSGLLYMKVETEDLVLDLEVTDPLGESVAFSSQRHHAPNMELLPNGTLLWLSTPEVVPPEDLNILVTVVDGCPRQNTEVINLVTVACEDVCGPGGLCTPDPSMPQGQGHYICQCGSGFWGSNCEQNVNECASNPCVHGQCVDGANGYTCDCLDGYGDTHCDQPTGTLGEWSEFGPCTKDCDYGMITRTRNCSAPPCAPDSTEENVLCNEFNCDEMDGEQYEGSVLIFKAADMLHIVVEESNILVTAVEALDIHCVNNGRDCCSAVGIYTENPRSTDSPFKLTDVRTGKGYPNVGGNPDDIRLKVVAEVTQSDFQDFCQASASRKKRDLSGAQVVMVDKDFIDYAMSDNSMLFVQRVGVEVGVEGVDEVEDGDKVWVIALICVSAVLLIVVPTLTALLVKKRKVKPSDKQRILQEEQAMNSLSRPSSARSIMPPIDIRLTEHAPSSLTIKSLEPDRATAVPTMSLTKQSEEITAPRAVLDERFVQSRPSSARSIRSARVHPANQKTQ